MRRIVGLIALIALVVIALSCASDIVLEEPPSLKGVYKGWYIITELGEQPVEHKQTINWIFDGKQYNMSMDTLHPGYNEGLCICKVYGDYVVEDKVRLRQSGRGTEHAGCSTCRQTYNPEGSFNIDRSTDTLKLTRKDTDKDPPLLKEIKLLRVSGE